MDPLPEPISAPKPTLRSVSELAVFGRYGLRAGWSMAIAACLFVICDPWMLLSKGAQPLEIRPAQALISETIGLVAVSVATLLLALIERRRMRVYGIDGRTWLNVFPGAFWGLASLSVLVFVLRGFHLLVFDGLALHGPAMFLYGAKWMLAFLLVGLFEEYSTRGFLQFTLTRGMMGLGRTLSPEHTRAAAFWIAATIMSIVFGALHLGNGGETPVGIGMVCCAGMLFSYALWRTGSLWWAIGFHMTWDWAQSFLYGVPDSGNLSAGRLFFTHPNGSPLLSGGADGPEGSLLVLPTLLLVALVIRYTTRQGVQPPLEQVGAAGARPVEAG